MRAWLANYDFNLPLIDAVNDPDLPDIRSALAALSLGEGLDSGYYAAQEMADAVTLVWSEAQDKVPVAHGEAVRHLGDILARDDLGYQRLLYETVGTLLPQDAAGHLAWLVARMAERADMYRVVRAAGIGSPALPGR
ncbi:hypothetical protein [Sphingobium sp. RAC03]|uniref:hypothetical protein n=1 Tax=Sphingobium sp. RAC03 TaxID=1843368 RepID=UPI00083D2AD5|nr:hypothetical protein [Sphingobium sp. RAC03]AOF96052.1 hypothetical protein BSY17_3092 [Sphingobium sp. RAC03]